MRVTVILTLHWFRLLPQTLSSILRWALCPDEKFISHWRGHLGMRQFVERDRVFPFSISDHLYICKSDSSSQKHQMKGQVAGWGMNMMLKQTEKKNFSLSYRTCTQGRRKCFIQGRSHVVLRQFLSSWHHVHQKYEEYFFKVISILY